MLWFKIKIWIYHFLHKWHPRGIPIRNDIRLRIWCGLIDNNLAPLKCHECYSNELQTKNTSYINYDVCEMECTCKHCKTKVGYWAYGHWEC